jgi:hypothetical protein
LNVPRVLPIKPRKSNKIEQEERNRIYGLPAVKMPKFGFPVDGSAYSARQIEAMMRQTLEVEAGQMNYVEEEELNHAAPGPGEDDQPVPQDQQPCNITCKVTQPATRPAAVVSLVLNPVGYHVNVPHSHLTTQVQPNHSPRPEQENLHRTFTMPEYPHLEDEMAKTHLEDRKSYVHKSTCQEVEKDKTYFGDVHMPDNKDQQTPTGC